MNWPARRRARREFMRRLRITELEKTTGFELSYPELDLPTIRVVRNPNGFDWEPWIAQGFLGWHDTTAGSKRACVKKARERLWQIALANSEEAAEVNLG